MMLALNVLQTVECHSAPLSNTEKTLVKKSEMKGVIWYYCLWFQVCLGKGVGGKRLSFFLLPRFHFCRRFHSFTMKGNKIRWGE
jgi:hypothetical protein